MVPRSEEDDAPALDLAELPSLAHQELDTHRELRALARKAAWEMPLLSTLRKPFRPPTAATPLRWRYTTYMGEEHPAARKVVVEFSVHDLPGLTDEQRLTLRKLAGPRWDPHTEIVRMGCESFETQAQNKRFLADTIAKLIQEAKDGEDKFRDVPLDTRHAREREKRRARRGLKRQFPVEWRMTPERKAELERRRGGKAVELEAPAEEPVEAVSSPPEDPPAGESEREHLAAMLTAAEDTAEIEDLSSEQPFEVERQPEHVQAEAAPPLAPSRPVVSGIDAIDAARQRQLTEVPVMAEVAQHAPRGKRGKREAGPTRGGW